MGAATVVSAFVAPWQATAVFAVIVLAMLLRYLRLRRWIVKHDERTRRLE